MCPFTASSQSINLLSIQTNCSKQTSLPAINRPAAGALIVLALTWAVGTATVPSPVWRLETEPSACVADGATKRAAQMHLSQIAITVGR